MVVLVAKTHLLQLIRSTDYVYYVKYGPSIKSIGYKTPFFDMHKPPQTGCIFNGGMRVTEELTEQSKTGSFRGDYNKPLLLRMVIYSHTVQLK